MLLCSCTEQEKDAAPPQNQSEQQGPDSKKTFDHRIECGEDSLGTWYQPSECREHCSMDPIAIDVVNDPGLEDCEFTFCWSTDCSGAPEKCFRVADDGKDYDAVSSGNDDNLVYQLCQCCGQAEGGGGPPYGISCAYPILVDKNGKEILKLDPSTGETEVELPDFKNHCCSDGIKLTYDPNANPPQSAHLIIECL